MFINFKILPLFLASAFIFTNCTKDEEQVQEPIKAETANQKGEHDFDVAKDGTVTFKAEIVYFHFDDYTLTKEGMDRLARLADYMHKNKSDKLKIEGHCDERGSTEYNLALGQLRAQSVKNHLATLGIDHSRLGTVSFGEERPAESGRTEDSWSKNRRAEFQFVSN